MSDYTPTTEEAPAEYRIRIGTQLPYIPTTEVMRKRHGNEDWKQEQFDRWLAEVKAEAVAEWLAERMAAFEKADLEAYEQGETE